MCGNFLVDLDATFGKFQFTYLNLYGADKFSRAAQVLFLANSSLPAEARVTDIKKFQQTRYDLRSEQKIEDDARQYCDQWAEYIFKSIADYRSDMLKRLEDD